MNRISWFEIPVLDTARAVTFYDSIYDTSIQPGPVSSSDFQMSMFPDQSGVSGALMYGPGYVPGHAGSLLYLNGGDDLSIALDKVEAAGGKILTPKTDYWS